MPQIAVGSTNLCSVAGNQQSKLRLLDVLKRLQVGEFEEEIVSLGGEQLAISKGTKNIPEIFNIYNKQPVIVQKFISKSNFLSGSVSYLESPSGIIGSSTPIKSSSHASNTTDHELDVTGSPLRCPFLNNVFESPVSSTRSRSTNRKKATQLLKYRFSGFPLKQARLISKQLLEALSKCGHENVFCNPVWIVVDGKDRQQTAFLCLHHGPEHSFLGSITRLGPFTEIEQIPSLTYLTGNISRCIKNGGGGIESSAKALYFVLSNEVEDGSSIALSCEWARPSAILSKPTVIAKTEALVYLDVDDPRSMAQSIHVELEIVSSFLKAVESEELTWVVKDNGKSTIDALGEYFESFGDREVTKSGRPTSTDTLALDFDKVIQEKFLNTRMNLNFTDSVWEILKDTRSFNELKTGLDFVFKTISDGDLRPQIPAESGTKVGNLSRDLMRGKAALPDLDEMKALEMLVEVGLEKIKKDYITLFQAGELASGEQLMPFINWQAYNNPHGTCLRNLEKLHTALQVVVLLHQHLRLPQLVLIECTEIILSKLEQSEDIIENFELPIQTSLVQSLMENTHPHQWQVQLKNINDIAETELTFVVSRNKIMCNEDEGAGLGAVPQFEANSNEEIEEELPIYYSSVINKTKNLMVSYSSSCDKSDCTE